MRKSAVQNEARRRTRQNTQSPNLLLSCNCLRGPLVPIALQKSRSSKHLKSARIAEEFFLHRQFHHGPQPASTLGSP